MYFLTKKIARKISDVTKARDLPSKAAQNSPKTTKKATPLFSSSTDDDTNDLFKVTKKIDTNNKPKTSLFDDSSSPDDLFQPVVEKKQTPVVKTVETTKKPVSLFDDSSSPDDLFQPTLVKTTDTKIKPGSLFDDSSSPEELFKASKKTLDETKQNDDDSTQVKAVRPSAGKNMLFSPDALAASGLFKKLADKKDGNEIEEENKQANTKDSVKVDTEGKIAAESKKSTIFDSDEDLFNFKATIEGLDFSRVRDYYLAQSYGRVDLKFSMQDRTFMLPGKSSDYIDDKDSGEKKPINLCAWLITSLEK